MRGTVRSEILIHHSISELASNSQIYFSGLNNRKRKELDRGTGNLLRK